MPWTFHQLTFSSPWRRDAVTSWRCDVTIALMKQIDFSLRFCFVRKISFFASFGLRTKKMNFLTNFWASWELGSFFTNGRFSFLWKKQKQKIKPDEIKKQDFSKIISFWIISDSQSSFFVIDKNLSCWRREI